jgi:hypothetical protein
MHMDLSYKIDDPYAYMEMVRHPTPLSIAYPYRPS